MFKNVSFNGGGLWATITWYQMIMQNKWSCKINDAL